jgi:hypothetical protein
MARNALLGLAAILLASASAAAQDAPVAAGAAPDAGAYAWAGQCRACHEAIYAAWAKTKHARALDALAADQRQAGSECVGCHLTGLTTPLTVEGATVNANVQCEACHGAGKAHAEAAVAGNAGSVPLTSKPGERLCLGCHNQKSPHYRGFFYDALKGLVHRR